MADENRPFIGYRSAGRRPESQQDRRAAADAPLSALRGMVSGVLGAPGDIESLIRMLPGLSEKTVLPTSEDVEKRLPMRELNQTPTGKAFTTAGQLGGGFYTGPGSPLRVAAALPSAVSRAGRDFLMSTSPVNVVKPKGGNWLAGSVERVVEPMKRGEYENQAVRDLRRVRPELTVEQARDFIQAVPVAPEDAAMNRWLETKLAKYIKNEMATPEDPLRALAERGIMHSEITPTGYNVARARKEAGFPEEGMGVSPMAKVWEDRADTFINELRASDITKGYPGEIEANPWLLKVPPETRVYDMLRGADEDLGFAHLTDELRNAINPASGLPESLLWKYQDLEKVTVPQAVERVAKINEWRAAQKAEADMARAMGPATQLIKEYPEQGFKWVELRQPKETGKKITVEKNAMELPDMDQAMMREVAEDMAYDEGLEAGTREFDEFVRASMADFSSTKKVEMDESIKALEDALKYEGETMGHCVGGYCPDVVEGRSKIFSLRDKKGQPHVTIEVQPGRKLTEKDMPDDVRDMLSEQYGDASREEFEAAVQQYLQSRSVPDAIVQIKGKANRAPNAEYLPAVQDFVRSGNFGKVGDLQNAGLIDVTRAGPLMKALQDIYGQHMGVGMDKFNAAVEAAPDAQRFMTKDELLKFLGETPPEAKARGGQVRGYAEGGQVSAGEAEASPIDFYKFSDRQLASGNDTSVLGFGTGANVGGGRLDAALEMMRMQRAQDVIPQEMQNRTARASYSKQLGDLGINATALKPIDVDGVYIGMLNGSIPLGLGRLLLGIQAAKTPLNTGVTGHSIGYSERVGPGSLNANVQRSRSGNVSGNVEYRLPFSEGGQVSGANFPTDDFDPARIDAIVDKLHAMNAA